MHLAPPRLNSPRGQALPPDRRVQAHGAGAVDRARGVETFHVRHGLAHGVPAVADEREEAPAITLLVTDLLGDRHADLAGELGTHAELMQLNRTYAKLFNMQAEGYR